MSADGKQEGVGPVRPFEAERVIDPQVPGTAPATQSYFRINCSDGELKTKLKDHFNNELKVDSNDVIEKFLELKREEKGGKIRGARPTRLPN